MKLRITKGTLTPKQAIIFSVVGVLAFGTLILSAYLYFGIVTWDLLFIGAIGSSLSLFFPWVSLELQTRNKCIRAYNRFVYLSVGILIVVAITQWDADKVAFPLWALVVVIIAAIAAYSVMVYYAVLNYIKWLNGQIEDNTS